MTATRIGRTSALVALVASMSLLGFARSAAAEPVVCTDSGGCNYWPAPDCSEITPDDEAQWLAYIYAGGPPPTRDLDYAGCLGF